MVEFFIKDISVWPDRSTGNTSGQWLIPNDFKRKIGTIKEQIFFGDELFVQS